MRIAKSKLFAVPLLCVAGFGIGNIGARGAYHAYRAARPMAPVLPPTAAAPPRAVPAHLGAESPELRALRLAEGEMFSAVPEPDESDFPVTKPRRRDTKRTSAGDETTSRGGRDEYATDGLRAPGLGVPRNARVEEYIRFFTQSSEGRRLFVTWLRRSGRYRDIILAAANERKLPQDLISVVFIESGFWPTAVSSAGAVGLWQFMPQTGRAYGLTVTNRVDERRSIWRSTDAALDHLKDLHDRFHNWEMALAAYNMGYKQLAARAEELGTDDFWALSAIPDVLPRETQLYVPKIMAVAVILNNLEAFHLDDTELAPPVNSSEMDVPPGVALSTVARAAGTSLETIRSMNQEFLRDLVPDTGKQPTMHVPSSGLARAKVMLPRLFGEADGAEEKVAPDFDWGRDEVGGRKKNRLDMTGVKSPYFDEVPSIELPKRDRTTTDEKAEPTTPAGAGPEAPPPADAATAPTCNAKPGEDDSACEKAKAATTTASASTKREKSASKAPRRTVFYRVNKGDTIASVARTFGVSPASVASTNGLSERDELESGALLRLRVAPESLKKLHPRTTADDRPKTSQRTHSRL